MLEQRFPVAVFNRRFPGLEVPSVRIDEVHTSQRITQILCAMGHRNLCMVTGIVTASPWSGTGRTAGWIDALKEHSLLADCSVPLYILPPYSGTSQYNPWFAEQMHSPRRPTVLVFCGASPAEHFLVDPRFAEMRVPEDLSVVVLEPGRRSFTVNGRPPLTVAQIDVHRAAECCIEMVEKLLGGDLATPSIRVPEDMTLTESIGPAPHDKDRQ